MILFLFSLVKFHVLSNQIIGFVIGSEPSSRKGSVKVFVAHPADLGLTLSDWRYTPPGQKQEVSYKKDNSTL